MGVLRGLGPAVVAVLVVEGVVAGIFIAARYLTRVFMRGSPGWDDFTLMFTWILQMSFVGMSIAACTQGMGAHSSDLTIEMFARAVKLELVAQFLVSIAMGTSKVGVSLFLMRIVTNKCHCHVFVVSSYGLLPSPLSLTSDYLYQTSPSVMWTSSEMTLTVICVSVPALRPLWKGLSTHGFSSSGGYQQYHDGSGRNDVPIEFRDLSASDKQHGYEASAARSPTKRDDNDSDTCILENGNGHLGGIHRKQDIELIYEEEVTATTSRQHL
ncbi:MAG: hypothetical protein Q9165_001774 [Trypethelium subeluteriae]